MRNHNRNSLLRAGKALKLFKSVVVLFFTLFLFRVSKNFVFFKMHTFCVILAVFICGIDCDKRKSPDVAEQQCYSTYEVNGEQDADLLHFWQFGKLPNEAENKTCVFQCILNEVGPENLNNLFNHWMSKKVANWTDSKHEMFDLISKNCQPIPHSSSPCDAVLNFTMCTSNITKTVLSDVCSQREVGALQMYKENMASVTNYCKQTVNKSASINLTFFGRVPILIISVLISIAILVVLFYLCNSNTVEPPYNALEGAD